MKRVRGRGEGVDGDGDGRGSEGAWGRGRARSYVGVQPVGAFAFVTSRSFLRVRRLHLRSYSSHPLRTPLPLVHIPPIHSRPSVHPLLSVRIPSLHSVCPVPSYPLPSFCPSRSFVFIVFVPSSAPSLRSSTSPFPIVSSFSFSCSFPFVLFRLYFVFVSTLLYAHSMLTFSVLDERRGDTAG